MKLNYISQETETFFNVANSIPVVAGFGATARVTLGLGQSVSGAAIAVSGASFEVARRALSMSIESFGLSKKIPLPKGELFNHMMVYGSDHASHGALNVVRGAVEGALSITILGPLALFIYQVRDENNKFSPLYPYAL